ncbi:MAG: branched-chain amino acid ABC transporter permease [Anaerolineae bacterium]
MNHIILLQQLVNALQLGSSYALIAVGYTMVYGVLRLINFAHADIFMVGAYIGYFFAGGFVFPILGLPPGWAFIPVMLVAMVGAALSGVVIERVAYRPLRTAPRLSLLITAIGVSLALEHGTRAGIGPNFLPFPAVVSKAPIEVGGVIFTEALIWVLITSFLLMAALSYLVRNTMIGKAMRAVSYDKEAALMMGIDINRIIVYTFMVGSAEAAAAAVMWCQVFPMIDPYMGLMPGIKAFVSAVVGGIGSVPGALAGGFILGILETATAAFLPSMYRDAIAFTILIIMLIVKPTGLFGVGVLEKV